MCVCVAMHMYGNDLFDCHVELISFLGWLESIYLNERCGKTICYGATF